MHCAWAGCVVAARASPHAFTRASISFSDRDYVYNSPSRVQGRMCLRICTGVHFTLVGAHSQLVRAVMQLCAP